LGTHPGSGGDPDVLPGSGRAGPAANQLAAAAFAGAAEELELDDESEDDVLEEDDALSFAGAALVEELEERESVR